MLTSLPAKAVPFVNIQDGLTLAQAVVDTVRDPLVVLDPNLRVIAASRSFVTGLAGSPKPPSMSDAATSLARPSLPSGSEVEPARTITLMETIGEGLATVTIAGSVAAFDPASPPPVTAQPGRRPAMAADAMILLTALTSFPPPAASAPW